MASHRKRECFFIEIDFVFELFNLVSVSSQLVVGLLECECHFAIFIDEPLLLSPDMLQFPTSLVLSYFEASAFLIIIFGMVVVVVYKFDLLG